jgi:signal transduction histidine kinase
LQQRVTALIRERQAALSAHAGGTPAETFAAIVRANLADAVIVTDGAGKVLYPSSLAVADAGMRVEASPDWARARELEFQKNDLAGAAEIYGRIAESGREANARARAMQAQAACWLKAGETERALARLAELAGDASLRHAGSAQGALIGLDAQLLILKTLARWSRGAPAAGPEQNAARAPRPQQVFADLVARLNDYAAAGLPANQRRFLMSEVQGLASGRSLLAGDVASESPASRLLQNVTFPTLAAEHLAADYLDQNPAPPADAKLQRTPLAKVWRLPSADRTVVALWREERLRAELAKQLEALALPDVRVSVLAPGEAATTLKMPVPPQDAGEFLPGWRLALGFRDGDPLAVASARQARFYLWMGVGVVAIIGVLAVMVARYVAAQMRLARMKDDLVSTVSHELKTPVASMRVLLDTLAAGRCRDEAQMHRYVHLAAKENLRLSHLIENFLVFSRLERGQQQFRFTVLSPEEMARSALDALGEKLTGPPCHLTTQFAPDLPSIRGDADALSTVLVNLLDNACKYTNGEKHLEVRVYAEGEQVVFAVTDNGIGIAPEEQRRIFDRFYQVDQSLTRQRGGCGLGLSIVRSIVEAHHGTVEVESAPRWGSTFRVKIPILKKKEILVE